MSVRTIWERLTGNPAGLRPPDPPPGDRWAPQNQRIHVASGDEVRLTAESTGWLEYRTVGMHITSHDDASRLALRWRLQEAEAEIGRLRREIDRLTDPDGDR